MGASGGTSANENQSANNAANQAQNTLNGYAGAGTNQNVQNVLGQYGSGGLSLQQAISQLGNSAQSPGATNGSGQTTNGTQDTSGGTNMGAVDQLFTGPATAGLAAQSQVSSNPLYSGLFGSSGLQGQQEANYGTATNNYNNATGNLASDRQALSGNDPSYGLQASDLSAYGQASNALGRQSAQTNQGIAQSLAARGLGSSNNGAAIGSYAGAYGNQNEALAGLQNQIAQQRITTAQGLAQARNNSDLQQQGNAQSFAGQSASGANQTGALANQAYQGQLASNMQGAENNYNELAGGAASAQQYQTNQQNINNSQFSQAQQTKQQAGGPITSALGSALGTAAGQGIATGVKAGGSALAAAL